MRQQTVTLLPETLTFTSYKNTEDEKLKSAEIKKTRILNEVRLLRECHNLVKDVKVNSDNSVIDIVFFGERDSIFDTCI